MKLLFKLFLLSPLLVIIPSCFLNKQQKENAELEDGMCLIVDPLEEGNDYHVDEFKEVFNNSPKSVSGLGIVYTEFVNYMPTNICEKYGVTAYRVTYEMNGEDTDFYDYYLMHDKHIYNAGVIGARKDGTSSFIQFLFSDVNQDGNVEITTSYCCHMISTLCYLSTLDTKTGIFLHTQSVEDKWLYFKYENKEINIYQKEFNGFSIEGQEILYSPINSYKRNYHLFDEDLTIRGESFRTKVSLNKGETTFPLIYQGLKIRLYITTEMTYLGETFTYTNGSTYKAGALPVFTAKDGSTLQMEYWDENMSVTTFTIMHLDVITKQYAFYDTFDNMNPSSIYDISLSYRDEIVEQSDVLEVKNI